MSMHLYDESDYFAPREERRTLFAEDVCRPGWIDSLPMPAAPPLYHPNADIDPDDWAGPELPLPRDWRRPVQPKPLRD